MAGLFGPVHNTYLDSKRAFPSQVRFCSYNSLKVPIHGYVGAFKSAETFSPQLGSLFIHSIYNRACNTGAKAVVALIGKLQLQSEMVSESAKAPGFSFLPDTGHNTGPEPLPALVRTMYPGTLERLGQGNKVEAWLSL